MFWNKKVTLERFNDYVSHVDVRLTAIFRNLDPRTKSLESKLDLILDHLKLKYVPETETKEPAKLVEKKRMFGLGIDYAKPDDNDAFLWAYNNRVQTPTPPKKKGRPKKK